MVFPPDWEAEKTAKRQDIEEAQELFHSRSFQVRCRNDAPLHNERPDIFFVGF